MLKRIYNGFLFGVGFFLSGAFVLGLADLSKTFSRLFA